ncbi:50S ribosomal protein L25/general stress protein Ctc [Candidatus Methylospira mobilis]|uniref:Large ribosomal subunit protein bL25 n=1 Tax=Candidatus Methylospira mobilis TaxID=1808979 RepID=A0A5Q0BIW1_9GAMM|nr:50S ribosomal protein L25/general stress protein Ctc [Candidatus Methylospira mobilis]QFY43753.1 50S ribosomal protein L25/general stress protein Ctc [Candidatus Methylospira mobilis]WNV04742.1 50S ribosomal protein L25/general stress protein Ctc [Candidatus Methylospira mobilis]
MVGSFEFDAELRTGSGKGDARRTRRTGKVPAIVYGGGADPLKLNLSHNQVVKRLGNDAVYSHILSLKFDGKQERVILKALERHPSRPIIMHMDFLRVSEKDKLRVHVPLHFINQDIAVGVKRSGGVVAHGMAEVEVECLPQHLPEFIAVDLADLDIGDAIHLSGLKLPPGVEVPELQHGADHDQLVAAIHAPRTSDAAE